MRIKNNSTKKSRKLKFDCCVNAKIHFIIFFAYYYSPLPIGSYEIIKRLQIGLNNQQFGHKEGQNFQFFGETIKASPPVCMLECFSLLIRDLYR